MAMTRMTRSSRSILRQGIDDDDNSDDDDNGDKQKRPAAGGNNKTKRWWKSLPCLCVQWASWISALENPHLEGWWAGVRGVVAALLARPCSGLGRPGGPPSSSSSPSSCHCSASGVEKSGEK
eukprot:scaffold71535_cov32-Prasinocladus_malaysianus.AAC.1